MENENWIAIILFISHENVVSLLYFKHHLCVCVCLRWGGGEGGGRIFALIRLYLYFSSSLSAVVV